MKRSGLGLIVLLIVALVIAYLVTTQIRKTSTSPTSTEQNAVQQAQDAVDAINSAQQNALEQMEQ